MNSKILRFFQAPPSRKLQRIKFVWLKIFTWFRYSWRLHSLGKRSIIGTPIFWTPEYLEVGDDVFIWPGSRFEGIDFSTGEDALHPRILLGDGVTFQQYCHVTAAQYVEIGARTSVLFGVMITDTDHRYDQVSISPGKQPLEVSPTIIGEDCFIGAGASIQAGTQLGRHCVVGTNAVVRGNFPDYSVLVGVPARIVKRYDFMLAKWRRTDSSGAFLTD